MEKRYFYVTDLDFQVKAIPLDTIDILARYAVTLPARPGMSVSLSYSEALMENLSKNKDSDVYRYGYDLTTSFEGGRVLCLAIELTLLENGFRENGITEETMMRYNNIVSKYAEELQRNASRFPDGVNTISSVIKGQSFMSM